MFGKNDKADPEWLAKVGFFADFSDSELEKVADLGVKVSAAPGAELTDQGRFGDVCYVIVEGSANVLIGGEYVTTVGPGSMVGEMALIGHRPRSATVVAETDMTLVAFSTEEFRELLQQNPLAQERVLGLLGARLAENAKREEST